MITIPKDTFSNLNHEKQQRIFEAAVNEFSEKPFAESTLSNIIKEAGIPRGSFYQYFEDKLDLYKYVIYKFGEIKMGFMGDLLPNPDKTPFLDLVRQLYLIGIKFALNNPKAVKMTSYIFSSRDIVFEEVMSEGLATAKTFYIGYIESDKKLGRINPEIDTDIFADMIINLVNDIAIEEFNSESFETNFDRMLEKFDKKIFILKKGILLGE